MKPGNFYAADLGNSRIKISQIYDGLVIRDTISMPNNDFLQYPELDTMYSKSIVFASVNSKVSDALRENNKDMKIFEIGKEIPIPILNKTDKPEQTGIDRLINCWYAYDFYGKPVIVIDAGTAITIDYCNENGEFEGGVIMAGLDLQLKALHTFTSALPEVEFIEKKKFNPVGKTTEEAMLASVKFGIPGQIKACVDEMTKKTKIKPLIFLTGGSSNILQLQLTKIMKLKYKFFAFDIVSTTSNFSIAAIHKIAYKYFAQNV